MIDTSMIVVIWLCSVCLVLFDTYAFKLFPVTGRRFQYDKLSQKITAIFAIICRSTSFTYTVIQVLYFKATVSPFDGKAVLLIIGALEACWIALVLLMHALSPAMERFQGFGDRVFAFYLVLSWIAIGLPVLTVLCVGLRFAFFPSTIQNITFLDWLGIFWGLMWGCWICSIFMRSHADKNL